MKNHLIQNRSELSNRRSKDSSLKSSSDEPKKTNKIIKRSLNFANTSVNEDDVADSSSYTFENSTTKEMLKDNQEKESTEIHFLGNVNSPLLSASSKTSMEADFSPSSVITTSESDLIVIEGDEISAASRSDAEVQMVANYLKQARLQMLNSTGMDPRFKKLLDALLDVIAGEFCSIPDDRDWMDKIISAKNSILFICFLMCLISTSVILLLRSGIGGSGYYPPPPT